MITSYKVQKWRRVPGHIRVRIKQPSAFYNKVGIIRGVMHNMVNHSINGDMYEVVIPSVKKRVVFFQRYFVVLNPFIKVKGR